MTIRVKSVFNFKSVSVASSNLHCHVVYTYGFNGLTLCVCVPVYNGQLIVPRVTITLCGDRVGFYLVLDVQPRMVRAGG